MIGDLRSQIRSYKNTEEIKLFKKYLKETNPNKINQGIIKITIKPVKKDSNGL